MIIGVGAILPGLSGGVLCVIFGLYQPIMETLSHPFRGIRKYWRILIPTAVGIGFGFLGLARLTSVLMQQNSEAATCVFIGLILGMIPQLWHDAGKQGRGKPAISAMIGCFVVFLTLFFFLNGGNQLSVEPNIGWYVFCGVAWGISIIVPGMSSSSILLLFGLYQPMLDGISRLSLTVLIPMVFGLALTIFSLSKLINYCYQKYYSISSHVIIGIILATVIPILPFHHITSTAIIIDLVCIIAGIFAALGINFVCSKLFDEKNEKTVRE